MQPPKVYLAGWDVFRPDSLHVGARLKAACINLGLEGLYPADNCIPKELPPHKVAAWLFDANKRLILESDVVVANLNPFRGHEPDSGTSWEIGFAYAMNKPVFGYMWNAGRTMLDRIPNNGGVDQHGLQIEAFGLPVNLMLACAVREVVDGSAEGCLSRVAQLYCHPEQKPVPMSPELA